MPLAGSGEADASGVALEMADEGGGVGRVVPTTIVASDLVGVADPPVVGAFSGVQPTVARTKTARTQPGTRLDEANNRLTPPILAPRLGVGLGGGSDNRDRYQSDR